MLWQRLTPLYDAGEAKAIVRMVLEERFGFSYTDIACGKENSLSADQRAELDEIMQRLEEAEPVQYILGIADSAAGLSTLNQVYSFRVQRPKNWYIGYWRLTGKTSTSKQIRNISWISEQALAVLPSVLHWL